MEDNFYDYRADRRPNSIFQLTDASYAQLMPQLRKALGEDWANTVIRRRGRFVILEMDLSE